MISNVNKIMVVLDLNDYKLGKKTLQKKKNPENLDILWNWKLIC